MPEKAKSPLNRKSQVITQGDKRAPNRAMLRAVGFKDADFDKPIIGVANGQSTVTPCNAGLGKLADVASAEILNQGGMPRLGARLSPWVITWQGDRKTLLVPFGHEIVWTGSGVEMTPVSNLRHYVIAHPNGDSGYIQQPSIILVND